MFCLDGVAKRCKQGLFVCDTTDFVREKISKGFGEKLTSVQIKGISDGKLTVCSCGELISICVAEAKLTAQAAAKLEIKCTEVNGIHDLDIEELYIPLGVTHISNLSGCGNLRKVVLPWTVTEIADWTFEGCVSLTEIDLSHCTHIGRCAFAGCESLTSVVIPKTMQCIQNKAFTNCYGLRSVTVLQDDLLIGDDVFHNCTDVVITGAKYSDAIKYAKNYNLPYKYLV